jgi:hypothetical protein
MKLVATGDDSVFAILTPYLFVVGNLMIAAIATVTIVLIAKGRLLQN